MNKITLFISMCMAALIAAGTTARTDTEFTYQGELKDNGGLANGSFNLDVTLWDALVSGNQIGSPLVLNGVPVTEGRFTVELDFGADAFDNSRRWLEVAVEGVTLSPRHPITRSPYAIQTRGIYVDENENVGIGTTTPAVTLHVEGPILSGGPNGGDVGARNPNNETAGVGLGWGNDVPRIRIGGEGAGTSSGFDIQTVGNRSLMRILNSGNVGIGTATPNHPLHITSSTNGGVLVETSGDTSSGDGVISLVQGNGAWAIVGVDGSGSGTGCAGVFSGDVVINGTLVKSGGAFKIDHPLDPANKFLSHSFVESPDMMNIYNGNAILDGSGRATITLPDWFETLNREFRYQLTCIGGFATVYVESEIENNQFTIAGGNPGLKVSWQVTGVRQDAWAEANRIPVEEQKVGYEAGYYLHPEVYDLDRSMSILAAREAHISVPESKAAMNDFQEGKQFEATASRTTDKFHTPHIKRARQN